MKKKPTYLCYVFGNGNAKLVGIFIVLDHVRQERDYVHGEGQALRRVDHGKVQEQGHPRENLDGRLVGVGVGAALEEEAVDAGEGRPFQLDLQFVHLNKNNGLTGCSSGQKNGFVLPFP